MISTILAACVGLAVVGHQVGFESAIFRDHPATVLLSPRIVWDDSSLVRVSPEHFKRAGYARMIELRDGVLLCVFEGEGSVFSCRSKDMGATWEEPVAVAWRQAGINMATPEVLELQDGSILACYNPRPYRVSGSRTFGIRTRKSYDGGRTWIHGRLLYEAGHKFTDGCWEPAAVQMPDGEILVFFADEAPFAGEEFDDQHISVLRSLDGGLTWTSKPEVVSYKQRGRDGMPVPLLLQSGELVCAIEQTVAVGKLQPAIIRLGVGDVLSEPVDEDSPFREEPLAGHLNRSVYAGAPYLRQLSTGDTILSYQGTEGRYDRLHSSDMKVWIGDGDARNFTACSVPFDVPRRRFALWNSVSVLRDDTVVALASTTAFSRRSEVWMIKGRLARSLVGKMVEKCCMMTNPSGCREKAFLSTP